MKKSAVNTTQFITIIFVLSMFVHGLYSVLNFGEFYTIIQEGFSKTEIFHERIFFYPVAYLPFVQLVLGVFMSIGYRFKLSLILSFIMFFFATYFYLDAENYILVLFYAFLAGLSAYLLNVKEGYTYSLKQYIYKVPTGEMQNS